MRTRAAIKHFKGEAALAKALDITVPAIYQWKTFPPDVRQLQIQRITEGKLKAEPECEARVLGLTLQRKTDRVD
jgi:hypothetical protein